MQLNLPELANSQQPKTYTKSSKKHKKTNYNPKILCKTEIIYKTEPKPPISCKNCSRVCVVHNSGT